MVLQKLEIVRNFFQNFLCGRDLIFEFIFYFPIGAVELLEMVVIVGAFLMFLIVVVFFRLLARLAILIIVVSVFISPSSVLVVLEEEIASFEPEPRFVKLLDVFVKSGRVWLLGVVVHITKWKPK